MKANYLLIIVSGVMLFYCGCKKGKSAAPDNPTETALDTAFTTSPITASIIGKWQITKERRQTLTATTGVITDVTYPSATFDSTYVYQFKSDSTATFLSGNIGLFTSAVIEVDGGTETVIPLIFTYKTSGSDLIIAYLHHISMGPSGNPGPYSETIVQLDATTLVLHGVVSYGAQKIVLDTYLTRK